MVWMFRISFSSPLLGGYDETEILRYAIRLICSIGADPGQTRSTQNLSSRYWQTGFLRRLSANCQEVPIPNWPGFPPSSCTQTSAASSGTSLPSHTNGIFPIAARPPLITFMKIPIPKFISKACDHSKRLEHNSNASLPSSGISPLLALTGHAVAQHQQRDCGIFNVGHGPLRSLAVAPHRCGAARHCGLSLQPRNRMMGEFTLLRTKLPFDASEWLPAKGPEKTIAGPLAAVGTLTLPTSQLLCPTRATM